MKDYNIHIYENNIIPIEKIKERHPYHIVIALNYRSTFFYKNEKGIKTLESALKVWGNGKTEKHHSFNFKNNKGSLYIRLPFKSSEDIHSTKIHKISPRQIDKIINRLINPDHHVYYVVNDSSDLQKEIIEENEALTSYTDNKYRHERMNQYIEEPGINKLTPEQISQAKFYLGEKEYERRIKENIPIIL